MAKSDLSAFTAEVRSRIYGHLLKQENALQMATQLVKEGEEFIRYVAENFSTDHNEASKCAAGILAKWDSQSHPDRYKTFDMSSMFDVHHLARLILEQEDVVAISQLEDDVVAALKRDEC